MPDLFKRKKMPTENQKTGKKNKGKTNVLFTT